MSESVVWNTLFYMNEVEGSIVESFKEQQAESNKIWKEYYSKHNKCPQCKSTDYSVTLIGCHKPPDINKATCWDCGWMGTRDEMV